jgi:hypothetical protein
MRTSKGLLAGLILMFALAIGCAPQMHIKLIPEGDPIRPGDTMAASFNATPTSITVAITNFGDEPLEVLWHKSSLVGIDGEALEIIHTGGRGLMAARAVSGQDYSAIPPRATLRDEIYVRRDVHFDDDDGWDVDSYIPYECGSFDCTFAGDLATRSVRLSLTFRRGQTEQTYEWRFRIAQAYYSIRGGRPPEQAP